MRRRTGITALVAAVGMGVSSPASAVDTQRRRVVTTTDIEIVEAVEFVRDTVEITDGSRKVLDVVAHTLQDHAWIKRMSVQVTGEDTRLAEARSSHLIDELVRRGIDRARLSPATETAAKAEVSFVIVERAAE